MYNNIELTIPTTEDILGGRGQKQLDIFKQEGVTATITDLALLSGGFPRWNNIRGQEIRLGSYYTKSYDRKDFYSNIHIITTEGKEDTEDIFKARTNTIRPKIIIHSQDLYSQIYSRKYKNKNGIDEVEFGEYPQYAAEYKVQDILEKEYNNNNLRKTGKDYTFDGSIIDNLEKQLFEPAIYEEYEYNNKKYIRYKVNYDSFRVEEISNHEIYKHGEYVWLEVSPVIWLIDDRTRTLISKKSLLSGIRFTNSNIYSGDFNETEMKEYLDTYMKKDLFYIIPKKKKKEESAQNTEINNIINEINKLLELNNNSNKLEITSKINTIIDEYNNSIKKNLDNNPSILTLDNLDEHYLYTKLKIELETILNTLKNKYNKYKEYFSMIELINKCINILENDPITSSTDLEQDILTIKNNILPILKDNKKLEELKNIFIKEKEPITNYINNKSNNYKYKTLNEFIIGIRKELQQYLLSVKKELLNQSIVKEINESYIQLALGEKIKSKNEYIKYIFNEIEKNINIINTKSNKEEQDILKDILSKKELNDTNILNSSLKISTLFIETYKIVLEIEEREKKEDYIIKR